jgi:aspartate dehydrogenase
MATKPHKKTIAIIGCGVIGSSLAADAEKNLKESVKSIVVWDIDRAKMSYISERCPSASQASSIEDAVKKADLVIEAANPQAAAELLGAALLHRKDIMIMSVGGILGNEHLLTEADMAGVRVIVPSGAIAGIDAIKSARIAGIESATLTTRKSPKSLKGAPYISEKGIDMDKITGETVIFEGSASEAVKGFPKNINVSALLSLAGIGAEKTRVRIVVSPEYTKNIHEIEVKGKAGTIFTRTENVPSPDNPGTSYLAVLAAMTSLREYFESVHIGT